MPKVRHRGKIQRQYPVSQNKRNELKEGETPFFLHSNCNKPGGMHQNKCERADRKRQKRQRNTPMDKRKSQKNSGRCQKKGYSGQYSGDPALQHKHSNSKWKQQKNPCGNPPQQRARTTEKQENQNLQQLLCRQQQGNPLAKICFHWNSLRSSSNVPASIEARIRRMRFKK